MQMIFFAFGLFLGALFSWLIIMITGTLPIFQKVKNKNRRTSSDENYWLLETKDESYLFTDEQIKTAKERAENNKEDLYTSR